MECEGCMDKGIVYLTAIITTILCFISGIIYLCLR